MRDQALAPLKVLDLTHYIAGPFCTKLLADYGAQVIKVERPGAGDPGRRLGPFYQDRPHQEASALFLHLNGNKLGVTLNLKSAAGVKVFLELLQWADVVVESFRPGVMDSLGLSFPRLKVIKPETIMTSISNFGQTGPYRDFKATEIVEYALGGPMLSTGIKAREPVKLGGRVGQIFAGHVAAIATLIAAYRRDFDNLGEHIDVSIMDTEAGNIDRQTYHLLAYQYNGRRHTRPESTDFFLMGIYPCKDGYLDIWGPDRFPGIPNMMDMPELMRTPEFATLGARMQPENSKSLDKIVREWFSQHTKKEIWEKAQRNRVMAAPIQSIAEGVADPHFRGREFWTTVERPYAGRAEYPGRLFAMGFNPWQLRRPAPLLGQHNQEVYCGMLGYSSEDLARLRQSGVI